MNNDIKISDAAMKTLAHKAALNSLLDATRALGDESPALRPLRAAVDTTAQELRVALKGLTATERQQAAEVVRQAQAE